MSKELNVYVVLLTWKRIPMLKKTLEMLRRQTHKDFTVHISNGNLPRKESIEKVAEMYRATGLNIQVSHDGNDQFAFRRFTVGRELAKQGADVVMFIDDDITFKDRYIEKCLEQYEPKTYKSGFAWSFQRGGQDYYRYRTRHWDNKQTIHYCGTGISMIDAKIFLEPGLLDAPEEAYKIEDVWLSYYAQHVMKWKVLYMETPGVIIGGSDNVALFKDILASKYNKADFLRLLIKKYGWRLKA